MAGRGRPAPTPLQAGGLQRGKVQAAAPACAWQQPSPGSSPPFCKRMPSDMRKASACTATLIIRWGTPAKILSVISNFEVCRDTYSLGIASM